MTRETKRSIALEPSVAVWMLAVSVLLGLIGCDSGMEPPAEPELVCSKTPQPGVLMPLEVGNYWTYHSERFDGRRDTFLTQITGKLDAARFGVEDASISEDFRPGARTVVLRNLVLKNEPDGLVIAGIITESDTIITRFRKYPLFSDQGDTFQSYAVSPEPT